MITKPDGTKLAYVSGTHIDVDVVTAAFFAALHDVILTELSGVERSPLTIFFHHIMRDSYSPDQMAKLIHNHVTKSQSHVETESPSHNDDYAAGGDAGDSVTEMYRDEQDEVTEPVKAWLCDRPTGTYVVIGTRADAEAHASVMRAGGVEELMLFGPCDYEVTKSRSDDAGDPALLELEVRGICTHEEFTRGRGQRTALQNC